MHGALQPELAMLSNRNLPWEYHFAVHTERLFGVFRLSLIPQSCSGRYPWFWGLEW